VKLVAHSYKCGVAIVEGNYRPAMAKLFDTVGFFALVFD
jgi:hypothetical protein